MRSLSLGFPFPHIKARETHFGKKLSKRHAQLHNRTDTKTCHCVVEPQSLTLFVCLICQRQSDYFSLPNLESKALRTITIVFKFLWFPSFLEQIKRSKLVKDRKDGGIRFPDIQSN